eukprot:gene19143-25753_t
MMEKAQETHELYCKLRDSLVTLDAEMKRARQDLPRILRKEGNTYTAVVEANEGLIRMQGVIGRMGSTNYGMAAKLAADEAEIAPIREAREECRAKVALRDSKLTELSSRVMAVKDELVFKTEALEDVNEQIESSTALEDVNEHLESLTVRDTPTELNIQSLQMELLDLKALEDVNEHLESLTALEDVNEHLESLTERDAPTDLQIQSLQMELLDLKDESEKLTRKKHAELHALLESNKEQEEVLVRLKEEQGVLCKTQAQLDEADELGMDPKPMRDPKNMRKMVVDMVQHNQEMVSQLGLAVQQVEGIQAKEAERDKEMRAAYEDTAALSQQVEGIQAEEAEREKEMRAAYEDTASLSQEIVRLTQELNVHLSESASKEEKLSVPTTSLMADNDEQFQAAQAAKIKGKLLACTASLMAKKDEQFQAAQASKYKADSGAEDLVAKAHGIAESEAERLAAKVHVMSEELHEVRQGMSVAAAAAAKSSKEEVLGFEVDVDRLVTHVQNELYDSEVILSKVESLITSTSPTAFIDMWVCLCQNELYDSKVILPKDGLSDSKAILSKVKSLVTRTSPKTSDELYDSKAILSKVESLITSTSPKASVRDPSLKSTFPVLDKEKAKDLIDTRDQVLRATLETNALRVRLDKLHECAVQQEAIKDAVASSLRQGESEAQQLLAEMVERLRFENKELQRKSTKSTRHVGSARKFVKTLKVKAITSEETSPPKASDA